jgi:hypothetical protein
MPFVLQGRKDHIWVVEEKPKERPKEIVMNWILDAYSNVYKTAMMRVAEVPQYLAAAEKMEQTRSGPMMNRLGKKR